jgi:hypothetical protein
LGSIGGIDRAQRGFDNGDDFAAFGVWPGALGHFAGILANTGTCPAADHQDF